MQTGVKQVFYFHAGATSLGGYLDNPVRFLPTPCSVALSPTGGAAVSEAPGVHFEKVVSFDSAYTFAAGRPLRINGPWIQRIVSVVNGFRLLDRVVAERLIAQVFIEHPAAGDGPRRISFEGSRFDNLHVDGRPVMPTINPVFLPPKESTVDVYDQEASAPAELPWPELSAVAYRQGDVLARNETLPAWVRDRYSWVTATRTPDLPNPAGYTICSLVDSINGLASGPNPGHCFELPDFGRVFLGEAVVYPQAISLAMVRVELGCAFSGHASAACVMSNGTTCPPS